MFGISIELPSALGHASQNLEGVSGDELVAGLGQVVRLQVAPRARMRFGCEIDKFGVSTSAFEL